MRSTSYFLLPLLPSSQVLKTRNGQLVEEHFDVYTNEKLIINMRSQVPSCTWEYREWKGEMLQVPET